MQYVRTLAFMLVCTAATAGAQRAYVDAGAGSSGDGKSWASAYSKLQDALKGAGSGGVVWVARGTYTGGFVVPQNVTLLGGFTPGDTRATQRDPAALATILDGAGKQRVVQLANGSVLDGFVVRNGNAPSPGGGGVLIDGVKATVRRCYFTQNTHSGGRGAAMHVIDNADARIEHSIFHKNLGPGHVIDFRTSRAVVTNIVVQDNIHNGLHFHLGSAVQIYNSIFAMNTGRGICHISANDQPVVENNLFWNNSGAPYHYRGNDLRTMTAVNALAYAKNNVAGDPLFRDAAQGDFRTKPGSPAIDAGRNDAGSGPLGPVGYYGASRLLDSDLNGSMQADIGAAEHQNILLSTALQTSPRRLDVRLDTTSLAPLLLIGTTPAAILVDPAGWLLLDPSQALVILPWAANQTVTLPVPGGLHGVPLVFQGLGVAKGAANLSNAVDRRL